MKELIGTEKQITWAKSILTDINVILDNVMEGVKYYHSQNEKRIKSTESRISKIKEMIDKTEHAGEVIEKYKKVSYSKSASEKVKAVLGPAHHELNIIFGADVVDYATAKEIGSEMTTVSFSKFRKDITIDRIDKELQITVDGVTGKTSVETKFQSENKDYNYIVTDPKIIKVFGAEGHEKIVITHESAEEMWRGTI